MEENSIVRQIWGKSLRKISLLYPIMMIYKASRLFRLNWLFKTAILPSRYAAEIKALDR